MDLPPTAAAIVAVAVAVAVVVVVVVVTGISSSASKKDAGKEDRWVWPAVADDCDGKCDDQECDIDEYAADPNVDLSAGFVEVVQVVVAAAAAAASLARISFRSRARSLPDTTPEAPFIIRSLPQLAAKSVFFCNAP